MLAIIGSLIPLAAKLFEYFLTKGGAEKDTIEAFYAFIKKLDKDSTNSVKLKISYEEQLKILKSKHAAKNKVPTKH